jgi:uncharacterized protein
MSLLRWIQRLYLCANNLLIAQKKSNMLELRPICENCGKDLPNGSDEAMICTFECTFCKDCVANVLYNVCPNCGGGFEKRPTRPQEKLLKNPPKTERLFKPIVAQNFEILLLKYKHLEPNKR